VGGFPSSPWPSEPPKPPTQHLCPRVLLSSTSSRGRGGAGLPAAGGRVQPTLIYAEKSPPGSCGKEVKGNIKLLPTWFTCGNFNFQQVWLAGLPCCLLAGRPQRLQGRASSAALKGQGKIKRSHKTSKSTFTRCHWPSSILLAFFSCLIYLAAHDNSISKTKNKSAWEFSFFTRNASKQHGQKVWTSAKTLHSVTLRKAVYKTSLKTSACLHASFNLTMSLLQTPNLMNNACPG